MLITFNGLSRVNHLIVLSQDVRSVTRGGWQVVTNVTEEHTTSIFYPEHGDSMFLSNACNYLYDYMVSQFTRPQSEHKGDKRQWMEDRYIFGRRLVVV
jgi:hypothetical protein